MQDARNNCAKPKAILSPDACRTQSEEERMLYLLKRNLGFVVEGGVSRPLTDSIVRKQILRSKAAIAVDFGAGQGKYGMMLRDIFGKKVHITAVEVFANTARYLKRKKIYDTVVSSDCQTWLEKNRQYYDLAVFGDILEHLRRDEIYRCIDIALNYFDKIIIVVPVGEERQGAIGGNIYEKHKTVITEDFFNRYNIAEKNLIPVRDERSRGKKLFKMNLLILKKRHSSRIAKII